MAKRVSVTLIDDFDGESTAEETVLFSIDGLGYEIDLSRDHAKALRAVFDDWVPHARKISGTSRRGATTAKKREAADRQQSTAAREWARAQGLQVSARGRISAEILEAYHAAQA